MISWEISVMKGSEMLLVLYKLKYQLVWENVHQDSVKVTIFSNNFMNVLLIVNKVRQFTECKVF